MVVKRPDYYDEFHCIASKCKHTCCAGWEIDVDKKTYDYYSHIQGKLGDELRKWIKPKEVPHFQMKHGMCPFLSKDHLCEVYQKLGEQAMCEVCTEYPRSYEEYGDTREMILALSCEEAGRIFFSKEAPISFLQQDNDAATSELSAAREDIESGTAEEEEEEEEEEHAAMKEDKKDESVGENVLHQIIEARDFCIDLLQNRTIPLKKRITYYLQFSKQIQSYIDSKQMDQLKDDMTEPSDIYQLKNQTTEPSDIHRFFQRRMDILMGMEVMEEEWNQESNNMMRAFYADSQRNEYIRIQREFEDFYQDHEYEYEHLLVYFTYRYITRAIEDHRFYDYARFSVLCYQAIKDMDCMTYLIHGNSFTFEDRIETVRIFCKQVEHSKKSVSYLLEQISGKKEEFL